MVRPLAILVLLGACSPATLLSASPGPLQPSPTAAARSPTAPVAPSTSQTELRVWRGYLASLELLLREPLWRQRGMVVLEARARLAANLARLPGTGVVLPRQLSSRARTLLGNLDALFQRVASAQPAPAVTPQSAQPSSSRPVGPLAAAAPASARNPDPEPAADISEAEVDDGGPPVDIIMPKRRSSGALQWPLPHVRITSSYGYRRDPISKRSGSFHDGLDLSAPRGTVVQAAADGRVTYAARRGGGGKVVVLLHGPGVKTVYAHLDQFLVTRGDFVSAGQPVGLVGSTGRATGPHLHFVVRVGGRSVNPLSVVGRARSALAAR